MPPEAPVFVYGTLKRGLGNHAVMLEAGGEFAGEARTVTRFPLVENGLPYLLEQPRRGHRVQGELYRLNNARGLAHLDRLEGHPNFYRRRLIEVESSGGSRLKAWVYFLARTHEHLSELPPLRAYGGRRFAQA